MISLFDRPRQFLCVFWAARILLCLSAFGFGGYLHAQVSSRFVVTPEQVQLAMQGRGWPLDGVQVRLAAAITATVAKPSLEIDSVAPGIGHQAMLRIACRVHTECLPFFASAVWPTEAPMPDLLAKSESKTRSASSLHINETEAAPLPELPTGSSSPANISASPLIRAGSSAMLLLEGAHIHIRLHVVFAQNGHVGDTVRVTTPDRKQVYIAEVLAPEVLKGEL